MSLLEVSGLRVVYPRRTSRAAKSREVVAVHEVSISVEAGQTVGLVGASGAGKSTVAKAILHLVPVQRGRITVGEHRVTTFGRRAPLSFRKDVQMVFQNSSSSLNPAWKVADILAEPLRIHFALPRERASQRTAELLDAVELPTAVRDRRPHDLSVGQRQRVAIARALATEPRLIVLDEPVSALDARTSDQVVAFLARTQHDTNVAYFVITHDIALARRWCSRIAVMERGRIVEQAPVDRLFGRPHHPFTPLLLASVLDPRPADTSGVAPATPEPQRSATSHPIGGRRPALTESPADPIRALVAQRRSRLRRGR
jgi:ABC-type glutathione transport system ATPase component